MSSMITLNGNILVALDTETTGANPCYNEVCQIAMVALDINLEPGKTFYTNVRPEHPERMHPLAVQTHGLTPSYLDQAPDRHTVADSLWEWYRSFDLAPGKGLIPLCHNAPFDIPFVQQMLGLELYNDVFKHPIRDSQALVVSMMDKSAYHGIKAPFNYANLKVCCQTLGVELDDAHDALADALATARVYRELLRRSAW